MHIGMLAGFTPVIRLIPIARGIIGGNMANDGPLNVGFDGSMTTWCRTGYTGEAYLGKKWTMKNIVRRCKVYSSGNWTSATQPSTVDFVLEGSHDTTNILDGTWTPLNSPVTRASADGTMVDLSNGLDVSTAYLAHRLRMRQIAYDGISIGQLLLNLTELEFYEYSYI